MTEQFSFKTLAEDVLTLEINTIIKADMSACKMPASRREALWSLAGEYHFKLEELGCRGTIRWDSGGLMSFRELYGCARNGIYKREKQLKNCKPSEKDTLQKELLILARIRDQCGQITTMFLKMADIYKIDEDQPTNLEKLEEIMNRQAEQRRQAELDTLLSETSDDVTPKMPKLEDLQYIRWNNDIDRPRMHNQNIPDLPLDAAQINLLRKAWEIGTEQILMQTVIQADGDVTTRISQHFLEHHDPLVLNMHNDGITTAVSFWANLVKTIKEMAGALMGGNLLR